MHTQIEQYLEQIETRLVDLPVAQRASEIEEMRQHMEVSVETYLSLGCSQEEAITQTLEQFGRAQTVGVELARAHERAMPARWDNVPIAAVLFLLANWLLQMGKNLLFPTVYPILNGRISISPASYACLVLVHLLIAFASGWLTAQIAPRRALAGIALKHVVTFAVALSVIVLFQQQMPFGRHEEIIRSFSLGWLKDFLLVMPVGMLGARLGRIWKQSRRRRMLSVA